VRRGGHGARGPRLGVLALGLVLLVLSGCAIRTFSAGPRLPDALPEFVIGRTTKAEALALLGPPQVVRRQFDGDLHVWRRTESRTTSLLLVPFVPLYRRTEGDARNDMIALLFDPQGVLSGVAGPAAAAR